MTKRLEVWRFGGLEVWRFGAHYLINLYVILAVVIDNIDGNTYLDLLSWKALRYEHHQDNFKKILSNDVTPFELCIKKTTVIETVNEDFHIKWHSIFKNAEKELI